MEIAIGAGLIGIIVFAVLSGLTNSVDQVRFGREQNRATQIMAEKLDIIRMYKWSQVNNTFIPTNFTAYYSPAPSSVDTTKNQKTVVVDKPDLGAVYQGTINISTPSFSEGYKTDLKQVTVALRWLSGRRMVQSEMTTLVSKYGLQNYIP